ncbi:MAG: RNA polymerase sigma factor [Mycobacterium sp.]
MSVEVTSPSESFAATVLPGVDVVHNLARRLTRSRVDSEDLLQETLERAWIAWRRGVRPDSLNAWLSTICLNVARDRARQSSRRPEVSWREDLDPAGAVDVEDLAIRRVQLSMIERALWTLSENQRVAITLMDICGLTAEETAQTTGCARGTVLARVHRGRKALARAVSDLAARPGPPRNEHSDLHDGGEHR